MRNKKLCVMLVLFLIICTGMLYAKSPNDSSNKWDGFRRYCWGANLEKAKENDPNLIKIEQEKKYDLAYWRRQNEKLIIGKADLNVLMYITYKDKFCGVAINSKGKDNFEYLKKAIFAYYGEGKKPNTFTDKWVWSEADTNGKVRAILEWKMFAKKANFVLFYSPIWKQYEADKEEDAKDAEDDF